MLCPLASSKRNASAELDGCGLCSTEVEASHCSACELLTAEASAGVTTGLKRRAVGHVDGQHISPACPFRHCGRYKLVQLNSGPRSQSPRNSSTAHVHCLFHQALRVSGCGAGRRRGCRECERSKCGQAIGQCSSMLLWAMAAPSVASSDIGKQKSAQNKCESPPIFPPQACPMLVRPGF